MYVVVNRITVKSAYAEDFAATFAESMSHLDGVPGHAPDPRWADVLESGGRETLREAFAWLS